MNSVDNSRVNKEANKQRVGGVNNAGDTSKENRLPVSGAQIATNLPRGGGQIAANRRESSQHAHKYTDIKVRYLVDLPDKSVDDVFGISIHPVEDKKESVETLKNDGDFRFTSKTITSISIEPLEDDNDDFFDQSNVKDGSDRVLDTDYPSLSYIYDEISNAIEDTKGFMCDSIINPYNYSYYKLYLDKYNRSLFLGDK